MERDLLTLSEIADQLDLPESTARYYKKKFKEFIPAVGEGRQMRYKPEAVEVLRMIAEGMNRNLNATEIAERLSTEFATNIDFRNQPQTIATTKQQQTDIVKKDDSQAMFEYIIKEQAEIIRQQAAIIERLTRQLEPGKPARSWLQKLFRRGKH